MTATRTSQSELMNAYINSRYDLYEVAHLTGASIDEILRWLTDAKTRSTLDNLRAAADQALAIRAAESRRAAINALEDVINQTNDLIEKRRAATTLLRALNTRRSTENEAAPTSTSPRNAQCVMPDASSSDTSPPSLDTMLAELACAMTSDSSDAANADNALAALHKACAEGAVINGEPVPNDVDDLLDDIELQPIAHIDILQPSVGDRVAAVRLDCAAHNGAGSSIGMALVNEDGWRIVEIIINDSS